MNTEKQAVFITGAGSGIGRALAFEAAARGARVCITDVNSDALANTERDLKKADAEVLAMGLDVSDRDAVFKMAEKANDEIGPIDIVFNNAGVSLSDTVEQMEYADFEWLMDINFWGVVHGTKAFLPGMLKRGKGHIVNVSSLFGLIGVPSQSAYCASKHAVKGFNESLYYELKGSGVQIHSVHPGGVDTGIIRNGLQKNNKDGVIDKKLMEKRFKKLAITTPEAAAKIIFKGVDSGTYRILVGSDAKRADRFCRWFPKWWLKVFDKAL